MILPYSTRKKVGPQSVGAERRKRLSLHCWTQAGFIPNSKKYQHLNCVYSPNGLALLPHHHQFIQASLFGHHLLPKFIKREESMRKIATLFVAGMLLTPSDPRTRCSG